MDCTCRIRETTMMRTKAGIVMLVCCLSGCKQGDGVGNRASVSVSEASILQAPPKEDSSVTPPHALGPDPAKQAELERHIRQRYGDQAVRSAEEQELIAFVEKFVETNGISTPTSRGHLVAQRGDGWNVTILDLNALRRGERPNELTYHVKRVDGHLKIIHGLVP